MSTDSVLIRSEGGSILSPLLDALAINLNGANLEDFVAELQVIIIIPNPMS